MWVIVSYGGVPDAVRLVDSLRADPASGVDLVLACNRPGDAEDARSRFADLIAAGGLRVVDYPDNPGYLPAVARVVDERPPAGHLVFSNADMIAGPDVVPALLAAFATWPEALLLAPRIIGERGIDVNPHLLRPPSARRLKALAALHRYPPVADVLLLRRNRHGSTLPATGTPGQKAWSGHGSCVALSHQFFERGGDLHYPFALFGEELWLGAEVERLQGEVRFVPDIELRHDEHAATGSGRRRGWVARVKYEGLRYWARRARDEGWS
jgi:GT2 family glycosyltransferase